MLIMAIDGIAKEGKPRNAIIGSPSDLSVTLMMPRLGSSSQSQIRPTTTGGINQGMMIMARIIIEFVRRDIMTAMMMARIVCKGMLSTT